MWPVLWSVLWPVLWLVLWPVLQSACAALQAPPRVCRAAAELWRTLATDSACHSAVSGAPTIWATPGPPTETTRTWWEREGEGVSVS